MRGLKPLIITTCPREISVAPYTGAWIETIVMNKVDAYSFVAPYTGAWIETP